jgi:hypothetical protein
MVSAIFIDFQLFYLFTGLIPVTYCQKLLFAAPGIPFSLIFAGKGGICVVWNVIVLWCWGNY